MYCVLLRSSLIVAICFYASGLQRALFLPFIDLLLVKAKVFSFYASDHKDSSLSSEGGKIATKDYRLIKHSLDHNEVRRLIA